MTGKDIYSSVKLISDKGFLTKRPLHAIGMSALFIVLTTCLVYTPALKNDFIWDDSQYISENTMIRSLSIQSLYRMLTTFHSGNWHPLTWISHTIDYTFWGHDPLGHHLTNIILHGLNTLLVFILAIRLMLRGEVIRISSPSKMSLPIPTQALLVASVAALLFGLHPLHVESVEWVAERKDLLCALFFLLTILSYLSYTSSVLKRHRWILFNTCLLFTFALMSKPMAVTLPVILLLLDFYPLNRLGSHLQKNLSVLLEKIPFFALSIASSTITIIAQNAGGAIKSFDRMPLSIRLVNGLHSLVFYLEKMIWPHKLVPFYPLPKYISPFDLQYVIHGILVLVITGICLWTVKNGKYLLFIVWSYYVITLLPVLGIIQVGDQAAADRYTYLPSLSIFLLVGIGISWAFERRVSKKHKGMLGGLVLAFICIFIILGQLTIKQIKLWRNAEILWSYVISAFPNKVPSAHNNLGLAYSKKDMVDEAISEYKKALTIRPHFAKPHNNLGNIYHRKGKLDEAISEYKKALVINPNFVEAHYNLGVAYGRKGKLDEAISEHRKVITIKPNFAVAHYNLCVSYNHKKNYKSAILHCDKAVELGYGVNPKLLESLKPYR